LNNMRVLPGKEEDLRAFREHYEEEEGEAGPKEIVKKTAAAKIVKGRGGRSVRSTPAEEAAEEAEDDEEDEESQTSPPARGSRKETAKAKPVPKRKRRR